MADRRISTGTLTDIADAIRSKTGNSALIAPKDMAEEINSIQTGGGGGGLDIARLVEGTYSGCTVDSDGRISNNNTSNLGTFPLTKPISVTQGDVITLVVVNTARLFHAWTFYQNGVSIGSLQTGNIGSAYVTSFTVPATGIIDAISLSFNQAYTVTNEKFIWMKNGVVLLA